MDIHEFMQAYQENIRQYNENVSQYIEIHRLMTMGGAPPTPAPAPAPATAQTPQRPATAAADSRRMVENTFLYYLFSPVLSGGAGAATAAGPTADQIAAATQEIQYHASLGGDTVCPISLESFHEGSPITQINHCGHYFHREPLARWFSTHSVCPICRHDIVGAAPAAAEEPTHEVRPAASNVLSRLLSLLDSSGNLGARNYRRNGTNELIYEFDVPISYNTFFPSDL